MTIGTATLLVAVMEPFSVAIPCGGRYASVQTTNTWSATKTPTADPLNGSDNSRVTVNWFNAPVNRPENLSTGVSFRHGGYTNYTENGVQYYVKNGSGDDGSNGGFKVADASHWAFAGTGLANGSVFGRGDGVNSRPIAGYEVDGALFSMSGGKPVVTGEDGTPTNFQILATDTCICHQLTFRYSWCRTQQPQRARLGNNGYFQAIYQQWHGVCCADH